MAHPRHPIDPAPHTALLLEAGELGDAVVTGQDPPEPAHLSFERLHRHHRSRADDGCLQIVEFGSGGVIQLAGEAGHGVDMTRRHPPGRQGVVHLGQLGAHRGPPGRGVSLTGRAAPTAGQQG